MMEMAKEYEKSVDSYLKQPAGRGYLVKVIIHGMTRILSLSCTCVTSNQRSGYVRDELVPDDGDHVVALYLCAGIILTGDIADIKLAKEPNWLVVYNIICIRISIPSSSRV
jgi:hypothetical protein